MENPEQSNSHDSARSDSISKGDNVAPESSSESGERSSERGSRPRREGGNNRNEGAPRRDNNRGDRGGGRSSPPRRDRDDNRGDRNDKPRFSGAPRGDRNDRPREDRGDRPSYPRRDDNNRGDNRGDRGDRPSFGDKPRFGGAPRGDRNDRPREDRGDRPSYPRRDRDDNNRGDNRGDRNSRPSFGDKPRFGGAPRGDRNDRPREDRGDRPSYPRRDRDDNNRGDRGNRNDRNDRNDRFQGNSDRGNAPDLNSNREPEFDAIKNPIFCALDMTSSETAQRVSGQVKDFVGGIKVGLEYFTANGAFGIRGLWHSRLPIFLDLKFHDIPNTVAGAVRSSCNLRPHMLTIHLAGGGEMIKAATDAAADFASRTSKKKPLILGVSILTSLDDENLKEVGFNEGTVDSVKRLVELGVKNGIDGIVCSPHEISALKAEFGDSIKYVVPGIRPSGTADDDQKRVMSPRDAIQNGADYLVIGRAITAAPDPRLVAKIIAGQINPGTEAAA